MTPPATPPGAPDPVLDDPMLRVLRERHPEVDIVVLPQTAPARQAPDLTVPQREQLAADLDRALDDLVARLSTDPAAGHVTRDSTWHTDEWDQTWLECIAVVGPLPDGANISLLRSTGHALLGLGWQARPVPGDRPRLVARHREGFEAAATVRPDSLVLSLRTPKVRVAEEQAS